MWECMTMVPEGRVPKFSEKIGRCRCIAENNMQKMSESSKWLRIQAIFVRPQCGVQAKKIAPRLPFDKSEAFTALQDIF